MSSDEFVVTPWNVEGDIDYEKLIKQFGTQKISPEILSKMKQITGEDHFMLRRGIFFSHRDLNLILDTVRTPFAACFCHGYQPMVFQEIGKKRSVLE
mgnify:CR=1 FL=1